MYANRKNRGGFTLTEVTVALTLSIIAGAGILALLLYATSNTRWGGFQVRYNIAARRATHHIARTVENAKAVGASTDSLNSLEDFVTKQVGINNAPNFDALRHLLKEFVHLLSGWLESCGVDEIETSSSEIENTSEIASKPQASQKSISGAINNSQDVINALKLICDYYKKKEPSSPVPLLLERAQRLVGKSFMDALMDIAPDGVSQASIIMGAKNEDE